MIFELLSTIALLCQASSGSALSSSLIRANNAQCQQRVLNCVLKENGGPGKGMKYSDQSLQTCVLKGAVAEE